MKSVAQTAGKLSLGTLNKSGKSSAIRSVPTLRKICSKLKGLSFLDEGVEPVIEMIDALLAKIPADGRIVGPLFWETQAVVSVLADVQRMKAISDGSLSLDLWRENFVPAEAKPTTELELVAEMQTPTDEIVDTAPINVLQDLDSELMRFIEEHKVDNPNPTKPEEPKGLTASTFDAELQSDTFARVVFALPEPEVPPMDSYFF